jgi:hypothetical protein
MTIFVTTSVYALAKRLGLEQADREFAKQVENPTGTSLGVARVIARLRKLDDLGLRVDLGVGTAAKMRSRMADYAWKSGADVWCSIDDDVDATQETLEHALAVVRATRGVVTVPYLLRRPSGEEVASCDLVEPVLVRVVAGVHVARSNVGGFGLVFVHRAALELVRRDGGAPMFTDIDDDNSTRPALFAELVGRGGRWYGEDWSFFLRCPRQVQIDALLDGVTNHDGRVMPCGELLNLPRPMYEGETTGVDDDANQTGPVGDAGA